MVALQRPLKEHVYEYIAARIESGELSAGDRVSEQTICDAMGVSRTPVREALIQLASDGYLDNQPRRGFRVRGFDRQNAIEVFQIMGPLDGQAAYLACPPTHGRRSGAAPLPRGLHGPRHRKRPHHQIR